MATKEEVEQELEQTKDEYEKLRTRYVETVTNLKLARDIIRAQTEVLNRHLRPLEPVEYEEDIPKPGKIIRVKKDNQ